MWIQTRTEKIMYPPRIHKFFVITYLTIVLMIVFGSSVVICSAESAGSSKSDFKKAAARVHSRGANDVSEPDSHSVPTEYEDDYYSSQSQELRGNVDSEDLSEIHGWEHQDSEEVRTISKCCPFGQALNVEGKCHKVDPNYKHDLTWHPNRTFVPEEGQLKTFNITDWDVIAPHEVHCAKNESAEIVSDLGKFVLISDGSLFLPHQRKHLDPHEFCFEQQIGKAAGRAIMACFTSDELGAGPKTLKKCCPATTIVQMMDNKLVCILIPGYNLSWDGSIVHESPVCKYGEVVVEIGNNGKISVGEDGSLITDTLHEPFDNYCIDHFQERDDVNATIKALVCMSHEVSEGEDASHNTSPPMPTGLSAIYGIALIISSICLALAALISLRLPELRSLHGKCQLSHLATLFTFFVLLAAVHLGAQSIPPKLCTFFAVAIHFCALSSFLWLNLLCVNIYLTFRSLRPPLAARRGETRRLFFLCVYAWGIPAAFCMFLWILDKPGTLDPMPTPEYGKHKCLISNREADFAYLFGPVGVLLLFNGILFCLTAQELLCGLWRLDNSDSINFRRKSMGIVVAKLGIVMGMGWIFDVASWGAGPKYYYLFYAADIFNSLQGLFIFMVLIWRKRVLEVLHLRKPSIIKDETLTGRPFLHHKHSTLSQTLTNGEQDTSLISAQDI